MKHRNDSKSDRGNGKKKKKYRKVRKLKHDLHYAVRIGLINGRLINNFGSRYHNQFSLNLYLNRSCYLAVLNLRLRISIESQTDFYLIS